MKSLPIYFRITSWSLAFQLQGMGLLNLFLSPDVLSGIRIPIVCAFVITLHLPMILWRGRQTLPSLRVILITFAIAVVFSISVLGADSPEYGKWKLGVFLCLSVVPTFLLLRYYQQRVNGLVPEFCRALMIFSFVPVIQIILLIPEAGLIGLKWFMLSRDLDVIGMARTLGVGALLFFAAFFRSETFLKRVVTLLVATIMIIGQLLLMQRGPLIGSMVGLISIFMVYLIKINTVGKIQRYFFLFISLLLIGFLFVSIPELTERFESQTLLQDERILIFKKASQDIHSMTWLIGEGLGNFNYSDSPGQYRQYPHNIFIELLLETGLIGLTLFVFYIITVTRDVFSRRARFYENTNSLLTVSKALFIFAFVNSLFSGDIATNYMIWVSGSLAVCSIQNTGSLVPNIK